MREIMKIERHRNFINFENKHNACTKKTYIKKEYLKHRKNLLCKHLAVHQMIS